MQSIKRWFRKRASETATTRTPPAPRMEETYRELLNLAVRDTLSRQGVPAEWITVETQVAFRAQRTRGMHLRLVVRKWEPRLLTYLVALQAAIRARLARLDPLSAAWLMGISWKFDIRDERLCPALPPTQYWQTAGEPVAIALAPAPAPAAWRERLDDLLRARHPSFDGRPPDETADFSPTQPMPRETRAS